MGKASARRTPEERIERRKARARLEQSKRAFYDAIRAQARHLSETTPMSYGQAVKKITTDLANGRAVPGVEIPEVDTASST